MLFMGLVNRGYICLQGIIPPIATAAL